LDWDPPAGPMYRAMHILTSGLLTPYGVGGVAGGAAGRVDAAGVGLDPTGIPGGEAITF
jgi:hypothetical protein